MQVREVVMQDLDEFGIVPGCVPGVHGLGIDWCHFVNFIGVAVRDPMSSILDRADEWD
jgi:hypothetical protein